MAKPQDTPAVMGTTNNPNPVTERFSAAEIEATTTIVSAAFSAIFNSLSWSDFFLTFFSSFFR